MCMFLAPRPFSTTGTRDDLQRNIKFDSPDVWYGRARHIVRVRYLDDDDIGANEADPTQFHSTYIDLVLMECFERFYDPDLPDAHMVFYLPKPKSTMYIVNLSTDILGRVSMFPFGDTGTISHSMRHLRGTAFRDDAKVDPANAPGTGSPLYHLNTWAMGWATDPDLSIEEYPSDEEQSTDEEEGGPSSSAAAAAEYEDEDSEDQQAELEEAASDADDDPVDTVDGIQSDADDDALAELQSDPEDDEDWH